MHNYMRSEMIRFSSFSSLSSTILMVSVLASCGYCYKNKKVLCFSCGHHFDHLNGMPFENVHDPGCLREQQNIPLKDGTQGLDQKELNEYYASLEDPTTVNDTDDTEEQQANSSDETAYHQHLQTQASNGASHQESTESAEANHYFPSTAKEPLPLNDLSHVQKDLEHSSPLRHACDYSEARYPHYANEDTRLKTFPENWPAAHTQRPEQLSKAGFFYAGYSDCVRCFYCGLGLKQWKDGDIPAYEHARFRPACKFNLLYKGKEYIDRVLEDFAPQQAKPSQDSYLGEGTSSAASIGASPAVNSTEGEMTAEKEPSLAEERLRCVKREHAQLKSRTVCLLCDTKQIGSVFLPCGHVIACQGCADKASTCQICKRHILGTANIYLS